MRLPTSAACLLGVALIAFGQGTGGTISGTVTDVDGRAVPGAQVQAKNEAGAQFQAKAAASGGYTLAELPAGTYQITIASPGLQPFMKRNVTVQAGQTARVDASLVDFASLGSVGEDRTFYANAFGAHDAPTGPAPRTPDGKPDFSGVWHTLRVVDPGKPEPLPWAEEVTKERQANNMKDLPSARCLPIGITLEGLLLGFRIMQNPTVLAFLYEDELPRQIYLDGRKHPEESLSPFVGHSVGKWEGDTLVVDAVGFNDKTWLDIQGHPHTDKMHIVERYRRKDLGHLDVEITIDDPGAYKKPWSMKRATELAGADEEVGQYVCTENNRDVQHLVGK
ncbi:MAG TPA: carboxypeptidase-like regulatory domain-containing protein [Bryobacteraceae bacterium]|nr:carboxypeptidase-like regulatory domain-containing protein [Bryobacteraceae bacterium]